MYKTMSRRTAPHHITTLHQEPSAEKKREERPTTLTLSWPPTSHTVKLMFLYSTVSTLKPAQGVAPRQGSRTPKWPLHCQPTNSQTPDIKRRGRQRRKTTPYTQMSIACRSKTGTIRLFPSHHRPARSTAPSILKLPRPINKWSGRPDLSACRTRNQISADGESPLPVVSGHRISNTLPPRPPHRRTPRTAGDDNKEFQTTARPSTWPSLNRPIAP